MKYLLDTCAISETAKRNPSEQVLRWLQSISHDELYLSSITIGEIAKGISRLPTDEPRRERIERWFSEIRKSFSQHILPFDEAVAIVWGRIVGDNIRRGRPMSFADSQIAATALVHKMTLVTRNVDDVKGMGVSMFNPFLQD